MKIYKIKAGYKKKGEMIYFSQLDLSRIFGRALARAGLPFYLTRGYKPRIRMSFGRALKLGREGESEVIFYFESPVSREELIQKLLSHLPAGLSIFNIEPING